METKSLQDPNKDYDYLTNSASCHDCTGLIPSLPSDEAEEESYEALYPYMPKTVKKSEG